MSNKPPHKRRPARRCEKVRELTHRELSTATLHALNDIAAQLRRLADLAERQAKP